MYNDTIYLQEGILNTVLSVYIPDAFLEGQLLKPAVIICPGGAYLGITEKEGEPVVLKFISEGYAAFVLRYSTGDMARFPAPFIDVAKAVLLVRTSAPKWKIDPDKICICGFSTGGHAAAAFCASWQEEFYKKLLGADNCLYKPNALILGYPLLNLKLFQLKNQENLEMKTLIEMMFIYTYGTTKPEPSLLNKWNITNQITSFMPPTFLWMTSEDSYLAVEDSLEFIKKLAMNKIAYEFHVFEKGEHGFALGGQSLANREKVRSFCNTDYWIQLAMNWLDAHAF